MKKMTKDGWDGSEEENNIQWTFAGALFYSIIVITTIGKPNLECALSRSKYKVVNKRKTETWKIALLCLQQITHLSIVSSKINREKMRVQHVQC